MKGSLPVKATLLHARKNINSKIKSLQKQAQLQQKTYYDTHAKNLKPLKEGERIVIQNYTNKQWEPGWVVGKDSYRPRCYIVKLDRTGNTLLRNRKFLRRVDRENFNYTEREFDELIDRFIDNDNCQDDVKEVRQSDQTNVVEHNVVASPETIYSPVKSRCGRLIKKPCRLIESC